MHARAVTAAIAGVTSSAILVLFWVRNRALPELAPLHAYRKAVLLALLLPGLVGLANYIRLRRPPIRVGIAILGILAVLHAIAITVWVIAAQPLARGLLVVGLVWVLVLIVGVLLHKAWRHAAETANALSSRGHR